MFILDFSALTKRLRTNTVFNFLTKPKKGFINIFGDYKDIVTIKELCEMLNVGKNTAYELIRSGAIKSVKIGRQIRICKEDVVAYLKRTQDQF